MEYVEALVTAPDGLVLSDDEAADHAFVLVLVQLVDQYFSSRFQKLGLMTTSWLVPPIPVLSWPFLLPGRLGRNLLVGRRSCQLVLLAIRGRLAFVFVTLLLFILAWSLRLLVVVALPSLVIGVPVSLIACLRVRVLHEITVFAEI